MSTTRAMVGLTMLFLGSLATGCRTAETERPIAKAEPIAPIAPTSTVAPTPEPPAAPAAPAEPSATAARVGATAAEGTLVVRRLVVAHGVKNREPVDPDTSFRGGNHKVYAFVEIENHGHAPGEVTVEFEPPNGGAPHGDVTLAVGDAPHWRTWAYTRTATEPGTWTAVVKSRKGEVLAQSTFEVAP